VHDEKAEEVIQKIFARVDSYREQRMKVLKETDRREETVLEAATTTSSDPPPAREVDNPTQAVVESESDDEERSLIVITNKMSTTRLDDEMQSRSPSPVRKKKKHHETEGVHDLLARICIETSDVAIREAIKKMQPIIIDDHNFATPEAIQTLSKMTSASYAQANFLFVYFLWNLDCWINNKKRALGFHGSLLEMYQQSVPFRSEWNKLELRYQMSTICTLIPLVRLISDFPRLIFIAVLRSLYGKITPLRKKLLSQHAKGKWCKRPRWF